MDWVSMWNNLAGQGIMFWSATVAVALGVTLVLTAGHLQWRRLRARSADFVSALPVRKPETLSDPAAVTFGRESNPKSANNPPHPQSIFQEQDRREMGVLMARLRSAADRLAEFQGSPPQIPTRLQDSKLKEDRGGVEYLFRAGKG